MIDGVKIKKLRVIPDERGFLMEMLRSDDEIFEKFGQVYVTAGYPGVVKGWHYHRKQTDYFTVVKGMAKVVLYDGREGSPTHGEINEFFMGDMNQILLKIPPLVMHGFK
ncbi:dTDP-4-dehydrorhamnose 3,5-epimerase, partial [Candidatus Hakubella thermalkaliphila]